MQVGHFKFTKELIEGTSAPTSYQFCSAVPATQMDH